MVRELDVCSVYVKYVTAGTHSKCRPRRIPKDVPTFLAKMNPRDREQFDNITKVFIESYYDVDPYDYFLCGFELYNKYFVPNKFTNKDIISVYRQKQKSKNDLYYSVVTDFKKSYNFTKEYMKGKKIRSSMFLAYCNDYIDNKKAPIYHLSKYKVDKYFLCWLIENKFLSLNDSDRKEISLLLRNYRQYISALKDSKIIPFV
jgi:hypothetical protein